MSVFVAGTTLSPSTRVHLFSIGCCDEKHVLVVARLEQGNSQTKERQEISARKRYYLAGGCNELGCRRQCPTTPSGSDLILQLGCDTRIDWVSGSMRRALFFLIRKEYDCTCAHHSGEKCVNTMGMESTLGLDIPATYAPNSASPRTMEEVRHLCHTLPNHSLMCTLSVCRQLSSTLVSFGCRLFTPTSMTRRSIAVGSRCVTLVTVVRLRVHNMEPACRVLQ